MTTYISEFTGAQVDTAVRLQLQTVRFALARPVVEVDGDDQDAVVLLPQQLLAPNTVYQLRIHLHIERTGTTPTYEEELPPSLLVNAFNVQGALDGTTNLDPQFAVQVAGDATGVTVEELRLLGAPVSGYGRELTFPATLIDDKEEVIVQYSGTIYTGNAPANMEIAARGVVGGDAYRFKVRDAMFEFNVASQVV